MRFILPVLVLFILTTQAHAQYLTGFDSVPLVTEKPDLFDDAVNVLPQMQSQSAIEPVTPVENSVKPKQSLEAVETYQDTTPQFHGYLTALQTSDPYEQPSANQVPQASQVSQASQNTPSENKQPANIDAKTMEYNEEQGIVTASGDVIIEQAGRILRADTVSYYLNEDRVVASGNVVLNDEDGNIYLSDEVELREELKNGFVEGFRAELQDGSRLQAVRGQHIDGNKTVLEDAVYTACEPCKKNPEKPPVWQIKADEVKHIKDEHRVSYQNARFEVYGVPVLYSPYLSHPDGTQDRKTGFLSPSAGYQSQLGAFVNSKYYIDIAPNKDATIGLTAMTKEIPLLTGEYRHRWDDGKLDILAGVTKSQRIERNSGVAITENEEWRGFLDADALYEINQNWRAGADIAIASDDQFLRQYDLDRQDVLTSQLYAERFDDRDYFDARLIYFQDIRIRTRQEDQPSLLPEITASYVGKPDSIPVIGGRWGVDASYLGLRREGGDQDMDRLSLDAEWQRRLVSDFGFVYDAQLHARGDLYHTNDRTIATLASGRSSDASEARFFPQAHFVSSYPMAKQTDKAQITLEPIASLTLSPNIDINSDIPNEDSRDATIDYSNIFNPNRFPGLDRLEDQSRVTYGVKTGLQGFDGTYGNVFLGQSFRFKKSNNPFPAGSGLDEQSSDIVGQFQGAYKDRHFVNYRFQLDNNTLSSQRHEIDLQSQIGKLGVNGLYVFAKGLEGTGIDESREQLKLDTNYQLSPKWRFNVGAIQDLGFNPGLREAYTSVDYNGQCVSWSLGGRRNLTNDVSGDSDFELLFRISLKNLGQFDGS